MICRQCRKEITGGGILFCPYCGTRLSGTAEREPSAEAAEWIRKAMKATGLPDRKKILEQARKACPEDPEIEWELLFIGTPDPKPPRGKLDFSIIKCYILEIYRTPGNFSGERRDRMRAQLFDDPQLQETCALFDDPQQKQREYLQRICREYLEIFLEGNNEIMGNWFGIRLERNKDKKLAVPIAKMIREVKKDGKLLPERQEELVQCLVQAYAGKTGGKTEHLDALMNE
jgi:hypothetical protein